MAMPPNDYYESPYSAPPPPSGGPSGRIIGVAVGLIVSTVAIAIIVVAVMIVRSGFFTGSATPAAAPSPSPEREPEESQEPAEEQEETEETEEEPVSEEALTDPIVEGWQGVAVGKRGLAYDVPAGWTVEDPGLMTGFEEEDPDAPFGYSPRVMMSGVANYGERDAECEDQYPPSPAAVGTSGMGELVDTAAGADALAREWAEAAYENDSGVPELAVGEAVPFEANGLEGHQVTVDVTVVEHECYPETAQVRVASVVAPSEDDVYNFILYSDTSGDQGPNVEDFDTIFSSLRPLES